MNRAKQKHTGTIREHVYEPRGGCKTMMECRDEEVLISGPAGTGKSRACLEKVHTMCLITPNTRALILRKTLRSLASTALVTYRNYVAKEAMETGTVVFYGGSQQEAAQYRYRNGSTITIGGLDNPVRVMSSEYDIIYIQEATEVTIEDIELCKTRLRNWRISFQQLLMDCNPDAETHPLKRRCNDHYTTLIESRHEDNPRLFNEDGTMTEKGAKYMSILDSLTGVRHARLRKGLWVSAEGIIYEEFDPNTHILDWAYDEDGNRLPLPAEWPRYWVIDFGFNHPFVLQCYAEGPDGELYMYREIYHTGRTVADHAAKIMSIVTKPVSTKYYDNINRVDREIVTYEWTEPVPSAVICDHDAEGRETFERATGLGTVRATKKVKDGIDLLKMRLREGADGLPRYYIMRDALVEQDPSLAQSLRPTCTVEEYPSYVWKTDTKGRTLDEPLKENDDGVDCSRYMTMFKDYKGSPRVSLISS
jgi:PBSX family phage terminase large subunit